MNVLKLKSWSPYLVGAAIGVLSWFTFATVDKPLGITTAFEHTAALAYRGIAADAKEQPYFLEKQAEGRLPKIDWEWMLVLGVFCGALLSSSLSQDRPTKVVPELWRARFGPHVFPRLATAFIGGVLMMFGARLAQGCTSGHGISGALQLAVSSYVFVGTFVVVGVAAARLLFGRTENSHV